MVSDRALLGDHHRAVPDLGSLGANDSSDNRDPDSVLDDPPDAEVPRSHRSVETCLRPDHQLGSLVLQGNRLFPQRLGGCRRILVELGLSHVGLAQAHLEVRSSLFASLDVLQTPGAVADRRKYRQARRQQRCPRVPRGRRGAMQKNIGQGSIDRGLKARQ